MTNIDMPNSENGCEFSWFCTVKIRIRLETFINRVDFKEFFFFLIGQLEIHNYGQV